MIRRKLWWSSGLLIGLLLVVAIAAGGGYQPASRFSANVMAPLHVMNYNDPQRLEIPADWDSFAKELAIAREIGVDAVTVDVWWGDVEALSDNQFDWSYYQTAFQKIKKAGLRLIPILAVHQCGGNVGDTYTSRLPRWLWRTLAGTAPVTDFKYQSELGNYSEEYVSLWADAAVQPQYLQFMRAFAQFCTKQGWTGLIDEIIISCGPAGELRYPSYNGHDWLYDAATSSGFWERKAADGTILLRGDRTNWPHRGAAQWYGRLPLQDFQRAMQAKYGKIDTLQEAWGTYGKDYSAFAQLQFPSEGTDHGYPDGKVFRADWLFKSGAYYRSQYGRDLIAWYNQALLAHGRRMLGLAEQAFGTGKFRKIPFGIKIPGVHWQMGTLGAAQPDAPRAAEITAGLLQPGVGFAVHYDLDSTAESNGHGYQNLLGIGKTLRRKVNIHFTCLEMGDNQSGGMGETKEQYSLAHTLVGWVAAEAERQGVTIKGENALAAGLTWTNEDFPGNWQDAWDYMNEALGKYPYAGITILRLPDVTTVTNPTNGKAVGKERYQELINRFKGNKLKADQ